MDPNSKKTGSSKESASSVNPNPSNIQAKSQAASRIIERLQQKAREVPILEPTKEDVPIEPAESIESKPAASAPSKAAMVTLSSEMMRVRQAFAHNIIKAQDILEVLMVRAEASQLEASKPLWDIFLERHFIAKADYIEWAEKEFASTPVSIAINEKSNIDPELMKILLDYHLVANDRLRKLLSIQVHLRHLGINYSFDQLLIQAKVLAPEMVAPLVAECQRRKGQASAPAFASTQRRDLSFLRNLLVQQKASAALTIFILGMLIPLCFVIFWPRRSPVQPRPVVVPEQPTQPAQPTQPSASPIGPASSNPQPAPQSPAQPGAKDEQLLEHPAIYVKWNDQAITPKRPIAQGDRPSYKLVLENPKVTKEEGGLMIQGDWQSIPPGIPRQGNAQLNLWNYDKAAILASQNLSVDWYKPIVWPSLGANLVSGFYMLQIIVVQPGSKLMSVEPKSTINRELAAQEQTFWIPFAIGNTSELQASYQKYFQNLQARFSILQNLQQQIIALLQQKHAQIKETWPTFSKEWQKDWKKLEEQRKAIPWNASGKLEQAFSAIVGLIATNQKQVQQWITGNSLFPPDAKSKQELEKHCSDFQNLITFEQKRISTLLQTWK